MEGENNKEQIKEQDFPVEATILYSFIKKSKPWSKLYLALCKLRDENKNPFTSKQVEEALWSEGITDLVHQHAWQMLDVLERMKLLVKFRKGKKMFFVFNENLFKNKDKLLAIAKEKILLKNEE